MAEGSIQHLSSPGISTLHKQVAVGSAGTVPPLLLMTDISIAQSLQKGNRFVEFPTLKQKLEGGQRAVCD